jgi:hypothetical protein
MLLGQAGRHMPVKTALLTKNKTKKKKKKTMKPCSRLFVYNRSVAHEDKVHFTAKEMGQKLVIFYGYKVL